MSEPRVADYENRGGSEVAYGFVYFEDGTRVAYTSLDGVVQDATGGWEPVTERHAKAAASYLKKQGVLIPAS
jgi:hypothetical protein